MTFLLWPAGVHGCCGQLVCVCCGRGREEGVLPRAAVDRCFVDSWLKFKHISLGGAFGTHAYEVRRELLLHSSRLSISESYFYVTKVARVRFSGRERTWSRCSVHPRYLVFGARLSFQLETLSLSWCKSQCVCCTHSSKLD